MPRAVIGAVTVFAMIVAGCGGKGSNDWASPCTDVEPAQPLAITGTVAYAAPRRSGSELMVADLGTEKALRLTTQRTRHDSVGAIAWSPDGMHIAYSGGKGGWNDTAYDDIWVIPSSGGSAARRLTDSREDDWDPAWSPDGTRLAFDRQDDGYNWVYVVNADGSGLRRLTRNFSWDPHWTPDGRISFVSRSGIWVMDADGSNKELLARAPVWISGYGGESTAWSPDGEWVAFTSRTALWVMRANGTGRRKIYGDPNRSTGAPEWSPDATRIAWTQGDGDFEIYVADRDGTEVRNVTDNKAVQDSGPTWTPDGSSLVFLRMCGTWKRSRHALLVVNADGGEPAKLPALPRLAPSSSYPSSYPVWKP